MPRFKLMMVHSCNILMCVYWANIKRLCDHTDFKWLHPQISKQNIFTVSSLRGPHSSLSFQGLVKSLEYFDPNKSPDHWPATSRASGLSSKTESLWATDGTPQGDLLGHPIKRLNTLHNYLKYCPSAWHLHFLPRL